jgi:hypothetical protein
MRAATLIECFEEEYDIARLPPFGSASTRDQSTPYAGRVLEPEGLARRELEANRTDPTPAEPTEIDLALLERLMSYRETTICAS